MRLVEKDPEGGWIARCPFSGFEIMEPGFRWNSRNAARGVVDEARIMGRNPAWEAKQRALIQSATAQ